MTIERNPDQERITKEEIQSGHFHNANAVIDHALAALREKNCQPKSWSSSSAIRLLSDWR